MFDTHYPCPRISIDTKRTNRGTLANSTHPLTPLEMSMAKMTPARDDKLDKKAGIKEGSKKDKAMDKKRGVPEMPFKPKAKK